MCVAYYLKKNERYEEMQFYKLMNKLGDWRHEQVQNNSVDSNSDSDHENRINLVHSFTSNRNYGRSLKELWVLAL